MVLSLKREMEMTKAPKLTAFRGCFEAGMDFETAIGCAGLSGAPEASIDALRNVWARWEAAYD